MIIVDSLLQPSAFIQRNTPFFLNRFAISFTIDEEQIQYCVSDIKSKKDISCSIEISMDAETKRINVLMFYPGLTELPDTHYFSSVCFFLIIHHFTLFFHLTSQYSIFIHTKKEIFNRFYSHLIDFEFLASHDIKHLMVDANSDFHPMNVDVSMITERLA